MSKQIRVTEEAHEILAEAKQEMEADYDVKITWSDFLKKLV